MPGNSNLSPSDQGAALRILDANLNRASEGLRVVEEYCRFALSDSQLTAHCKALRHDLTAALSQIPRQELVSSRDTLGDVGVPSLAPDSSHGLETIQVARSSALQVAIVNGERVKQAFRAIEEYAKLLAPDAARIVEALRYRWYTLEKALLVTATSRERLAEAQLYVLIDGATSECAFVERVRDLLAAGISILQLRDKTLDDRTLLARACLLKRTLLHFEVSADVAPHDKPPIKTLFIMNDRADLALLAQADGVHVGQDELSVSDVRRLVGPELIIGVSTHNIAQARQAVFDGANYLGCGPVFPSNTKAFDQFPGLDFLKEVAAEISLPAFAIGGINQGNVAAVLSAGFTRIAVGNAVWSMPSPGEAISAFESQLASRRDP